MLTGIPVVKLVCRGLVVLMGCIVLSACNTSNFDSGVRSGVPSQNVGSNSLAPQQVVGENQLIEETALVESQDNLLNGTSTSNLRTPDIQNANTQIASLPTGPGVSFLPVTGAPQGSVNSLSKSLQNAALNNKINLLTAGSSNAKYRVKGYFSALDDGTGTLLVYVWDVLDASGSRLHRISGQQHTSKKSVNPWAAISNSEIAQVANDTMSRLGSWLAKK